MYVRGQGIQIPQLEVVTLARYTQDVSNAMLKTRQLLKQNVTLGNHGLPKVSSHAWHDGNLSWHLQDVFHKDTMLMDNMIHVSQKITYLKHFNEELENYLSKKQSVII